MRNSGFELKFFQSLNCCRAKTEVMEEISSQNSDLGLEDLDKLEEKGQAENTNLREPLRGGSKNSRNDATNEAES